MPLISITYYFSNDTFSVTIMYFQIFADYISQFFKNSILDTETAKL